MFIQTEQTPNPATLKFLPGREVMAAGTADFPNAASAARSPLARRLFEIGDVSGVFFGSDFITVTKSGGSWPALKPVVLGTIMEHFMSGEPVIESPAAEAPEAKELSQEEAAIVGKGAAAFQHVACGGYEALTRSW